MEKRAGTLRSPSRSPRFSATRRADRLTDGAGSRAMGRDPDKRLKIMHIQTRQGVLCVKNIRFQVFCASLPSLMRVQQGQSKVLRRLPRRPAPQPRQLRPPLHAGPQR